MLLSPEEIEVRRKALTEKLGEINGKVEEYREGNKIEFIKLLDHQEKALSYIRAGKKTVLLQGGNRIGKTVFGACLTGAACLGVQPWDGGQLPDPLCRKGIKVRILCEDWEHHAKEVIVPELIKWLPIGHYSTSKNNVGVEAYFNFPGTGSTIEIMTNMQDTRLHESWHGELVWADEPTSFDKYIANKRGLLDSHGIFLLTMTAVKESWVLDQIVQNADPSFGCVTEVPMSANPYINRDAIQQYEASIPDSQKLARIHGGWLNLVGLIWSGFNQDTHIIDDFDIPTDWPVVAMIDYHTAKPHAISFFAFDQRENTYLVDEAWEHMGPEEVADEIIRRKKTKCWRIEKAFIDPLSKGDTQHIKRMGVTIEDSFTTIQKKLRTEGISLDVASKDKDSGIINVETMLKGVNGMPTLFFFNSLRNGIGKGDSREGTIYEIQRWVWDEDGKARKEKDHFMENLYRVTLAGISYTKPHSEIDSTPVTPYDPLTYGLNEPLYVQ